jgi:uncharacterized membrane protein (UPF0127 family)
MPWLLRDGEVLASAEVATTSRARRRGLLGRDRVEAPLVLRPCRQVHTIGMRIPIDVIWCDRRGRVTRIATLAPRRLSRIVWRADFVVEAAAGVASRWSLAVGDVLEVRSDGAGDR